MRRFVEKSSRNGRITLLFIDIGKSCHNREFFASSFNATREINFSRKLPNLQYVAQLLNLCDIKAISS